MNRHNFDLLPKDHQQSLGLIVLQSDVTIEDEFRYYFEGQPLSLLVSRIPFENEVNEQTLKQMADHIGDTVDLFPPNQRFQSVGYACTSGAMHIGSERIRQLVQQKRDSERVTNPLQAVSKALRHVGVERIAFLAPYASEVSQTMVDAFGQDGFLIQQSATFDENQDAHVGRISPESIYQSALKLHRLCQSESLPIGAIVIACTNMKCAGVIPRIEKETGLYVISSNLALAWDMCRSFPIQITNKGKLWQ